MKDNTSKKSVCKDNLSLDWIQQETPPRFVRLSSIEQSVTPRHKSRSKGVRSLMFSLLLFSAILLLFLVEVGSPTATQIEPADERQALTQYENTALISLPEEKPIVAQEEGLLTTVPNGPIPYGPIEKPAEEPVLESPNIEHTVKRGETLSSVFSKHGFSALDASQIDSKLRKNKDIDHRIKPGQKFVFKKAVADGELEELTIGVNLLESLTLTKNADSWSTKINRVPTITRTLEATGQIENNFAEAALVAGLNYEIVDEFVDLFSDKVRFHRDIQPGDQFSVIVDQQILEDGTVVANGRITGASIRTGGSDFKAINIVDQKGQERYVTEKGEPLGNTFLRYPLKFSRISSSFSHSRLHPVLKRRMPHLGVDFAAPRGTPVRSVADGKVTFAGRKGPNGIMIKITHNDRYRTAYLHLSKISSGIRRGNWVKRGQVIGAVGSTGRSTGPHLDFRLYDRGRSVNPLKAKLPKMNLNEKLVADKSKLKEIANSLDVLIEKSPQITNAT